MLYHLIKYLLNILIKIRNKEKRVPRSCFAGFVWICGTCQLVVQHLCVQQCCSTDGWAIQVFDPFEASKMSMTSCAEGRLEGSKFMQSYTNCAISAGHCCGTLHKETFNMRLVNTFDLAVHHIQPWALRQFIIMTCKPLIKGWASKLSKKQEIVGWQSEHTTLWNAYGPCHSRCMACLHIKLPAYLGLS